ncbi:hypothetical protein F5X99DRAFT_110456 [Biscogniauxia marginata]|nr:hypothetical protein F5X99DRAFT_110456 [Biscogniauxia marginata]
MVVGLTSLEPFGPWPLHAHFPEDTKVDSKTCDYHTSSSDPGLLQHHFNSSQADLSEVKATDKFWSCSRSHAERPKLKRRSKSDSQVPLCSTGYKERRIVADRSIASRSLTRTISLGACELPAFAVSVRGTKRSRAFHDVDGPETHTLPCKKRRLRLYLVTSRLSRPFSLPATHILNRESNEGPPMLSRFSKFDTMGSKRARHQSILIRKAAILNSVRIGVRQAAMPRGHAVMANSTARGNALRYSLQLVAASSLSTTGARFPDRSLSHEYPVPLVWQPHTTTFHPYMQGLFLPGQDVPGATSTSDTNTTETTVYASRASSIEPQKSPDTLSRIVTKTNRVVEEDGETSFPASDLAVRYADLSDDDMDDVYADFGVLFGPGARSPEDGETDEGHLYEEYLDEVDVIQWSA